MPFDLNMKPETYEAGGDLSAGQFHAVTFAADGQVDLAGAAAVQVVGILQDNAGAAAGDPVLVGPGLVGGVTKWKSSAAVARGAFVTTSANGRCVTAGTGESIWGIALEASGAANEVIAVKFGYLGLAA